jgi:hypothetical protein
MRKLAILLVLLAATLLRVQAQPGGVSADLQIDQSQYLVDEDLLVKVRVFNRSGQTVTLGGDEDWRTFEVLGEREAIMPKLGEMKVKAPFTLLSGQTVTKEFNLTPYFGFRKPGRYSVGAVINLPQWKQQIATKPTGFMLTEGFPLDSVGYLSFGVPAPPGVTNAAPDVRRYSLVKVTAMDRMILYFRLTDGAGRALRGFPLARMVSFGEPEVMLDQANNFHVLFQGGARSFHFFVVDPNGSVLTRQLYEYTQTRPRMRLKEDGWIMMAGGQRVLADTDIPASTPGTAKNP